MLRGSLQDWGNFVGEVAVVVGSTKCMLDKVDGAFVVAPTECDALNLDETTFRWFQPDDSKVLRAVGTGCVVEPCVAAQLECRATAPGGLCHFPGQVFG